MSGTPLQHGAPQRAGRDPQRLAPGTARQDRRPDASLIDRERAALGLPELRRSVFMRRRGSLPGAPRLRAVGAVIGWAHELSCDGPPCGCEKLAVRAQ